MLLQDDFVAQLVEQLTLNQWAVGSSPTEVTVPKRVRLTILKVSRTFLAFSLFLTFFSSSSGIILIQKIRIYSLPETLSKTSVYPFVYRGIHKIRAVSKRDSPNLYIKIDTTDLLLSYSLYNKSCLLIGSDSRFYIHSAGRGRNLGHLHICRYRVTIVTIPTIRFFEMVTYSCNLSIR